MSNDMSMPPPGHLGDNPTGPEDSKANLAQLLHNDGGDNEADDGGNNATGYYQQDGGGINNEGDCGAGDDGGSDNGLMDCAWIVKLRGLPWSVTAQDIMDFLAGVEVSGGPNGVHLITYSRNSSRPNGEAFVVCATEESYHKAFAYNKQSMGHRYIESEYMLGFYSSAFSVTFNLI